MLKHLLIVGLIVPASLAGYHVMAGGGATEGGFTASSFGVSFADLSIGSDYSLRRLHLLERDLYRIESRYVDKSRLDPKAMFDGALERVQRQFPEVLFIQPEGSNNLHVSESKEKLKTFWRVENDKKTNKWGSSPHKMSRKPRS